MVEGEDVGSEHRDSWDSLASAGAQREADVAMSESLRQDIQEPVQ